MRDRLTALGDSLSQPDQVRAIFRRALNGGAAEVFRDNANALRDRFADVENAWRQTGGSSTDPADANILFLGGMLASGTTGQQLFGSLSDVMVASGFNGARNFSALRSANTRRAAVLRARAGALRDAAHSAFVPSSSALAAPVEERRSGRFWVKGYRGFEDMKVLDGTPGYRYQASGFNVGYDYNVGNWVLGANIGHADGDLNNDGSSDDNRIRDYSVDLYGQYTWATGASLTGFCGYTFSDNDMVTYATLGPVYSDYRSDSVIAGAELGYGIRKGGLAVTPAVGVEYQYAVNEDYATRGVVFQQFRDMRSKSLEFPVRLSLAYSFSSGPAEGLSLSVSGGYSYEHYDDGAFTTVSFMRLGGAAFRIRGQGPGHHRWNGSAAVRYVRGKFDIAAEYAYSGRKKFSANTVGVTCGISF
ncbi:MAG: autotransporter outer membrane beta-barrel domain-containing protein [Planctomycetes bacterium]|nr:autotransporter outer membrane beta-barrel domain-containing protein [Planctomycetota bacterium]MCD7895106.1 autotransporter outer membrane beta-barrel domain-containing protein [Planctomycetaceae bacterium]